MDEKCPQSGQESGGQRGRDAKRRERGTDKAGEQ